MIRPFVRATFVFALFSCLHAAADAQTGGRFELEEEVALPYFGMGAGFVTTAHFTEVDEFNVLVEQVGLEPVSNPMLTYGAMLIFTPTFLRDTRLGAHLSIGYNSTQRDTIIDGESYTRMMRFGIRFMGGLQAEYALEITRRLILMPGLGISFGSYAIEFNQSRSAGEGFESVFDPQRINTGTGGNILNQAMLLERDVFFVRPGVALEFAPTGLLMLRLGAGYTLAMPFQWVDEGGVAYEDVPDLTTRGPYIEVGAFFGLFQQ